MIKAIANADQALSKPIIYADNLPTSILLYPFAAFFHPKLIFLAYLSVYYFSGYDLHATLIYLMGTGICLLTTFILKKFTKRPRPELVTSTSKPHHFRKKEKNNSFPSGDAIQSALFTAYLQYLGVPLPYLIVFHVLVCLGRVYYMCHWILDTVAATILGRLIAYELNELRVSKLLVPIVNGIGGEFMFLVIDGDKPIYECNFSKPERLQSYFIIHAALDSADIEMAKTKDLYLGQLKNDQFFMFCYINQVGLKLLLLFSHRRDMDKKAEMSIRDFLAQANRALAGVLMNPLYKRKETIRSAIFEQKVLALGKEYLRQFLERRK